MKEIIFNKTSDPIQSAGLAVLFQKIHNISDDDIEVKIIGNQVIVYGNELEEKFLELYNKIAKKHWDISNQKQIEKNEGFYYDENKDKFVRFPKVKQTGYSVLIHDAQPLTLEKSNYPQLKVIQKERPELYEKIIEYANKEKLKLGKKVLLNERNTAIPKIENLDFSPGGKKCFICGESYKKTEAIQSFSAFIGGSGSFTNYSSGGGKTEKVCYKCRLLQVLSTDFAFWNNDFQHKMVYVFFFQHTDLHKQIQLLEKTKSLLLPLESMRLNSYKSNYEIENKVKGYYPGLVYEYMLGLLYTLFKKYDIIQDNQTMDMETLEIIPSEFLEAELYYFSAKKFASTYRPTRSEKLNNLYYLFDFFKKLKDEIKRDFFNILGSFCLPYREKRENNKYANKVAENIIRVRSIINEAETVAATKFSEDNNYNFGVILKMVKFYESYINYGGNSNMEDALRDRAVKLGNMIGYRIFEKEKEKNKGKKPSGSAGKGEIVRLRKCRRLNLFLEQLIRLQSKYDIVISKEITDNIDEENFGYFRQFTIISAMNTFISQGWEKKDKSTGGNNE
jgi:hypothetical protein